MNRYIVFLMILFFCQTSLLAQVGINNDSPDNSAILDVKSSDKGVLFPRLSTTEKNNITSPATGLTVYDTGQNCLSVNIGTPAAPNWKCQDFSGSSTLPIYQVSNTPLIINETDPEFQTWVDVPSLNATFTLEETRVIRFDWIMFTGQNGPTTTDGYVQSFSVLKFDGVRDSASSNYLPMIHSVGNETYDYAMNPSTFTYSKVLTAGTYTVQVQVYAADFKGGTTSIAYGANFTGWQGGANMSNPEKSNAASCKLIVTYL